MSSTIDAYAWMDQAACKDMDLAEHDPFDPPTGGKYQSYVDEALAICARCPVMDECLSDALRMGDVYGVKGGKTAPEREAILNPPKVPAQRTPAEAKKPAPVPSTERKRAYRERNREAINAGKREAYQEKKAADEARAKKNERNARWRANNKEAINAGRREAYATRTPEQVEADRAIASERRREEWANLTGEALERKRAQNREWQAKHRAKQRAEREAAELVDEVVEETAVDQAEWSVA